MRNIERKIKKLTTEEENKVKTEECLWRNLRENGYKKTQIEGRRWRKEEERKQENKIKEEYMD